MDYQSIINAGNPYYDTLYNSVTDQLSYLCEPEVRDQLANTASAVFSKLSSNALGSCILGGIFSYYTVKTLLELGDKDGYIRKIIPFGKTIILGAISTFAMMNRTPGFEREIFIGACIGVSKSLWILPSSTIPLDRNAGASDDPLAVD